MHIYTALKITPPLKCIDRCIAEASDLRSDAGAARFAHAFYAHRFFIIARRNVILHKDNKLIYQREFYDFIELINYSKFHEEES